MYRLETSYRTSVTHALIIITTDTSITAAQVDGYKIQSTITTLRNHMKTTAPEAGACAKYLAEMNHHPTPHQTRMTWHNLLPGTNDLNWH